MLIIACFFVSIVGTLLHFVYEMSNHNKFVALFGAVNESTWEHIKICISATLLFSLVDGYMYGLNPNYFAAKSLSILSIMILIPAFFYFYTAFTKKSILPVDIISFILVVIISQVIFYKILNINEISFIFRYLSVILLFMEIACYMVLTMNPIKHFIFKDPITKKYGLKGHSHHEHHEK